MPNRVKYCHFDSMIHIHHLRLIDSKLRSALKPNCTHNARELNLRYHPVEQAGKRAPILIKLLNNTSKFIPIRLQLIHPKEMTEMEYKGNLPHFVQYFLKLGAKFRVGLFTCLGVYMKHEAVLVRIICATANGMAVHMQLVNDKLHKFEIVWLPTNTEPLGIAGIVVNNQFRRYPIPA